ncbi:MAG: ATP synthase F1 subunit delta [Clostridia bacterium]|nr:ATP synthase F1 subunit delta [Clostridia bacterium]
MAEISKEYAVALFSLACECGEERVVMDALERAEAVFREADGFMELLSSPGIPLGERVSLVEHAFDGSFPEHVVSFIQLLCERRRIGLFYECVKEYRALLDAREAVVTAKITSAVELTDSELAALKQKLEKISGNTVNLECVTDGDILGGLIVEMNGTVTDGSLRHRLREIKEVMNQ